MSGGGNDARAAARLAAGACPRRVLLLAPGLDEPGGIAAVARSAVAALDSPGRCWSLEAWTLHDDSAALARSERGGAVVQVRRAGGRRRRLVGWGLAEALRIRPRETLVLALHLHLAPVALPPALRRAVRLAIFLHGIEAWSPLRADRRVALAQADLLVANSRHTAARFKRSNPAFSGREVAVCHLGLPEAPPPEPLDVAGLDAPFVLVVGRLASGERYKGHDELLAAWPDVRARFPGCRLVVAGDGDDRPRLEARARELGVGDAVRFLGFVPAGQLADLYRSCALFALPSRGEGFGLVFLEAMRAGRACIGARGAAEEVIEHGRTGWIVNAARPEQLARALFELLGAPERRERMGRAGRARYLEWFTEERFQARLRASLGLPEGVARGPAPARGGPPPIG